MRQPAVSGRFYPAKPEGLRGSLESCFTDRLGPGLPGGAGNSRSIRGAIAPHAGYMASGANAAHVYRRLAEDGRPDAYVVIGPDHHGMCAENTVCSDSFLTPLGECGTHTEICRRLSMSVPDLPEAQVYEHSIEVQVPFIQFIDPDARIVPVMMSDQSPEAAMRLAEQLGEACDGFDVVFIASTDMSHYIPRAEAERLDSMVLDRVRAMDWRGLYRTVAENGISMCGYGPAAVVMMLCEGCTPEDILHTDSFDSLGLDPDSVVGYGSAVFVD